MAAQTTITIKLRNKLVKIHASRRHRKTISYMREHIAKHFKTSSDLVKISQKLNEYMEANNSNKFKPITVSINRADGFVKAALLGERPIEKITDKKTAASTTAKSESKATPQQIPATATTKASAEVQKQVTKDIGKKVEQKKEEKAQAANPKKSQTEKKTETPASEPAV